MMRALVVDDEPLAREGVRLCLHEDPEVEIVGEAANGEDAVDAIAGLRPDLVFLDVQMPGMDGFEVIDRVGVESMPAVIFVTTFEQHALRAFEVHAADYVLKPLQPKRLLGSVRHVRRSLSGASAAGERASRLDGLMREYRRPAAVETEAETGWISWIRVSEKDAFSLVGVEDVDWFEADGNYIRVHTGGKSHLIRGVLRGLDGRLDPSRFVRIHRSIILNVTRLKHVRPWFGGQHVAVLRDGTELRVSRTYRDLLLRPMF
ncbi:MAG: response regulator receiver [Gemmatimonadetes bacterium]|nr:response regulator receiver [Gemmatimonadota bacterium]